MSAEWERDPATKDGFVSNAGDAVTIHLKQEYMENDAVFAQVKQNFALSEANGVKSIKVVPFSGWENKRKQSYPKQQSPWGKNAAQGMIWYKTIIVIQKNKERFLLCYTRLMTSRTKMYL